MSSGFWYQTVGPLAMFLLGCTALALGVLIGWYARPDHARRKRKAESARVAPSIQGTEGQHDTPAAAEEALRNYQPVTPREWDGGQPRPNWNRRSG